MTISSSVAVWSTATRAPLGRVGWKVAIPQWKPRPGASFARASGGPTLTASRPQPRAPRPRGGGALGGAPGGAHAAVGDHVDVLAGLEQVLDPRSGRVRDCRRLR